MRFRKAVSACLQENTVESKGQHLLDARFFYVGTDNQGHITSEFVRQVAGPYMREINGIDLFLSPNFASTKFLSINPAALGYQVEEMVLSHIAQHGFVEAGLEFKKIKNIYFFSGKYPDYHAEEETALYIPTAFNYKAVDGVLICRTHELTAEGEKVAKTTVVGLQVTLSGHHKDTAPTWLASVRMWEQLLMADEINYKFCWIMEKDDHAANPVRVEFEEKVRGKSLVWPAHERLTIKIGTFNPTIAHNLRICRLHKTVGICKSLGTVDMGGRFVTSV